MTVCGHKAQHKYYKTLGCLQESCTKTNWGAELLRSLSCHTLGGWRPMSGTGDHRTSGMQEEAWIFNDKWMDSFKDGPLP